MSISKCSAVWKWMKYHFYIIIINTLFCRFKVKRRIKAKNDNYPGYFTLHVKVNIQRTFMNMFKIKNRQKSFLKSF